MLTESRRRTCESSGAQEDLVAGQSRTAVTRVEWQGRVSSMLLMGGLVVWASKPSVASFTGLGLKTRAKVLRRNGRHVAASRSLRRGEGIS